MTNEQRSINMTNEHLDAYLGQIKRIQEEQDRDKRAVWNQNSGKSYGNLGAGSETSSINPYNINNRNQYLEALRGTMALSLAGNDQRHRHALEQQNLDMGRAQLEMQKKAGDRSYELANRQLQFQKQGSDRAHELASRQQELSEKGFGLSTRALENQELAYKDSRYDAEFGKYLQTRQMYLNEKLKNREMDLKEYLAETNKALELFDKRLTLNQLLKVKEEVKTKKKTAQEALSDVLKMTGKDDIGTMMTLDAQEERDAAAGRRWQQEFSEGRRQFNAGEASRKAQFNANLAESKRQYNIDDAMRQLQFLQGQKQSILDERHRAKTNQQYQYNADRNFWLERERLNDDMYRYNQESEAKNSGSSFNALSSLVGTLAQMFIPNR